MIARPLIIKSFSRYWVMRVHQEFMKNLIFLVLHCLKQQPFQNEEEHMPHQPQAQAHP